MNEILDHDVQSGDSKLTNNGYDITFDNVIFPTTTTKRFLIMFRLPQSKEKSPLW